MAMVTKREHMRALERPDESEDLQEAAFRRCAKRLRRRHWRRDNIIHLDYLIHSHASHVFTG